MDYPIWIMRDEGRLAKGLAKEAGEGWSYPFWSKACDLFVYLNVHFRSYQFEEEVPSTFVANIHHQSPFESTRSDPGLGPFAPASANGVESKPSRTLFGPPAQPSAVVSVQPHAAPSHFCRNAVRFCEISSKVRKIRLKIPPLSSLPLGPGSSSGGSVDRPGPTH